MTDEDLVKNLAWFREEAGLESAYPVTHPMSMFIRAIAARERLKKREWVGLTDEEVNQLYTQIQEQVDKHWTDGGTSMMFPTTLYKAFEAILKEKNT